jgi:hypothetical protein
MAIAERVTDYWGITEANLLATPQLNYNRAKTRAIGDAIFDLYSEYLPGEPVPTETEIDALSSAVVERYIAASATLRLITPARDFYMQDRISKSLNAALGGGISATYVRKVDELDKLEADLREDMARLLSSVVAIIDPVPVAETHPNVPSVDFPANRVVDPVSEYTRRAVRNKKVVWIYGNAVLTN